MTMPPIVVDPIPPIHLEFVKQAYQIAMNAIHSVFPDPKGLVKEMTGIKAEITGLKGELNGLAVGANVVKGEFNVLNAQYDLIKTEGALIDVNEIKQKARGEHPEQLKPRLDDLFRITGQIRQSALPGLSSRITAAARDATAALQGVRRVGTDLDTARKALNTRVNKVEERAASNRTKSNEALRREGDRTRKAVKDLENAVNGTGRVMNQFSQRLRSIEQSLR